MRLTILQILFALALSAGAQPTQYILQPGPVDSKDIWTTSIYSEATCSTPGPGGGAEDEKLRVGGWSDLYYSLLQFNLSGLPTNTVSAVLYIYCYSLSGGGTPMYLDRITQQWDWRTSGTGCDRERLWWADKPSTQQWITGPLQTPTQGQWYAVDITDLYNAWQSGIYPNYGLELRPQVNSDNNFDDFYSAINTNYPTLRPKLVVSAFGAPSSLPQIIAQPLSQFVQLGDSVGLSVGANGQQPLFYQWLSGNTVLNGETNDTLTFDDAEIQDGGTYTVIVSNAFGSVTSAAASLAFLVNTNRQPTDSEVGTGTIPADIDSYFEVFKNGMFQTGIAPDSNLITIVITHGWKDDPSKWITAMASDLFDDVVGTNANIIAWNWQNEAATSDPVSAARLTPGQGRALGQALLAKLGPNYLAPIHFIGHSLGTLVNASAADYLHGDGAGPAPVKGQNAFLPQNTQMTLLDEAALADDPENVWAWFLYELQSYEAEQLMSPPPPSPYYVSAVPKQAAWVDNYTTAVGLVHVGAANVILTYLPPDAQQFYDALDFNTWWMAASSFHAYAHTWYDLSIVADGGASLMGNEWSFEREGITAAPQEGSVFIQNPEDSQLDLEPSDLLNGWAYIAQNIANEAGSAYNSVPGTVANAVVQIAGNAFMSVNGSFLQDSYVTSSTLTADTTALYVNLQTTAASHISPDGTFRPLDGGSGTSGNTPAYTWFQLAVPSNAVFMSFDFMLQGDGQSDEFAAAVQGTNIMSLETSLIQTNALINSGLIDASSWAGQTVELFLGIVGGTSSNATVTASGIRFYSVAQPSLQVQLSGTNAVVTWPISATSYLLQFTDDLTGTNAWAPVTNTPAFLNFQNSFTDTISNNSRFYRLSQQ